MTDSTQSPQPARLLGCGWCYEENGEEVHPHPECPIGRPAVVSSPRAILREAAEKLLDTDLGPRPGHSQDYGNGWSDATLRAQSQLRRLADEAQQDDLDEARHRERGMAQDIVTALARKAAASAGGSGAADETRGETGEGDPLRISEGLCPGFPDHCPNLRTIEPEPGVHLGGVRCGCADGSAS